MRADRLTVLRDFLKALPEETLRMDRWWCGTAGCAGGWACQIPEFQEAGLRLKSLDSPWARPRYEHHEGFLALGDFFGISLGQTCWIFEGSRYMEEYEAVPVITVVEHIDAVLEERIS